MLSHYHTDIDPDNENNSHSRVLRMVGSNKRVLEAGCSSGHVSEVLKAQGCSIVGIEIDPNMVSCPRTNPYVRTDGWDEEVAKINAKKAGVQP